MEVRRIGLSQFGLTSIPVGMPLSELELKLLPLYLHHRYQLLAAVKSLGGVNFTYAVRTPGGPNPPVVAEIVPPAKQKAALAAVLDTLSVDALRFPDRVLSLIPPTAFGYGDGTAEPFDRRTNPTFDPIGAATIAADVAVSALLQPQRAARVNEHASRNAENPSFSDVVTSLVTRTWGAPRATDRYGRAIQGAVETLTVTRLMELSADPNASADVRASATEGLRSVMKIAKLTANAHTLQTRDDITRFLNRPADVYKKTDPLPTPAGEPIGSKGPGGL